MLEKIIKITKHMKIKQKKFIKQHMKTKALIIKMESCVKMQAPLSEIFLSEEMRIL